MAATAVVMFMASVVAFIGGLSAALICWMLSE